MRADVAVRLAAAAAVALVVAGCGADQDPTTETPPEETTPPRGDDASTGAATQVSIVDQAFEPPAVEVAVGDTVEWTNTGQLPHTVTFAEGPDSGRLESGASFSHTFEEAGEYDYVCSIHPQMEATVTVTE